MKKVCIILMMAFAMTANAAQISGPIDIRAVANIEQPKSDIPVSASIDGHALTIYINENVGIAHIVVTNRNGVYIDSNNLFHTPDMATLLNVILPS
ncbi:MAG: hypothetical protein Q4F69_12345 [Bacteroidia bacterium]|nr:hypothetical protein [Bacteroidia bacterium]